MRRGKEAEEPNRRVARVERLLDSLQSGESGQDSGGFQIRELDSAVRGGRNFTATAMRRGILVGNSLVLRYAGETTPEGSFPIEILAIDHRGKLEEAPRGSVALRIDRVYECTDAASHISFVLSAYRRETSGAWGKTLRFSVFSDYKVVDSKNSHFRISRQ